MNKHSNEPQEDNNDAPLKTGSLAKYQSFVWGLLGVESSDPGVLKEPSTTIKPRSTAQHPEADSDMEEDTESPQTPVCIELSGETEEEKQKKLAQLGDILAKFLVEVETEQTRLTQVVPADAVSSIAESLSVPKKDGDTEKEVATSVVKEFYKVAHKDQQPIKGEPNSFMLDRVKVTKVGDKYKYEVPKDFTGMVANPIGKEEHETEFLIYVDGQFIKAINAADLAKMTAHEQGKLFEKSALSQGGPSQEKASNSEVASQPGGRTNPLDGLQSYVDSSDEQDLQRLGNKKGGGKKGKAHSNVPEFSLEGWSAELFDEPTDDPKPASQPVAPADNSHQREEHRLPPLSQLDISSPEQVAEPMEVDAGGTPSDHPTGETAMEVDAEVGDSSDVPENMDMGLEPQADANPKRNTTPTNRKRPNDNSTEQGNKRTRHQGNESSTADQGDDFAEQLEATIASARYFDEETAQPKAPEEDDLYDNVTENMASGELVSFVKGRYDGFQSRYKELKGRIQQSFPDLPFFTPIPGPQDPLEAWIAPEGSSLIEELQFYVGRIESDLADLGKEIEGLEGGDSTLLREKAEEIRNNINDLGFGCEKAERALSEAVAEKLGSIVETIKKKLKHCGFDIDQPLPLLPMIKGALDRHETVEVKDTIEKLSRATGQLQLVLSDFRNSGRNDSVSWDALNDQYIRYAKEHITNALGATSYSESLTHLDEALSLKIPRLEHSRPPKLRKNTFDGQTEDNTTHANNEVVERLYKKHQKLLSEYQELCDGCDQLIKGVEHYNDGLDVRYRLDLTGSLLDEPLDSPEYRLKSCLQRFLIIGLSKLNKELKGLNPATNDLELGAATTKAKSIEGELAECAKQLQLAQRSFEEIKEKRKIEQAKDPAAADYGLDDAPTQIATPKVEVQEVPAATTAKRMDVNELAKELRDHQLAKARQIKLDFTKQLRKLQEALKRLPKVSMSHELENFQEPLLAWETKVQKLLGSDSSPEDIEAKLLEQSESVAKLIGEVADLKELYGQRAEINELTHQINQEDLPEDIATRNEEIEGYIEARRNGLKATLNGEPKPETSEAAQDVEAHIAELKITLERLKTTERSQELSLNSEQLQHSVEQPEELEAPSIIEEGVSNKRHMLVQAQLYAAKVEGLAKAHAGLLKDIDNFDHSLLLAADPASSPEGSRQRALLERSEKIADNLYELGELGKQLRALTDDNLQDYRNLVTKTDNLLSEAKASFEEVQTERREQASLEREERLKKRAEPEVEELTDPREEERAPKASIIPVQEDNDHELEDEVEPLPAPSPREALIATERQVYSHSPEDTLIEVAKGFIGTDRTVPRGYMVKIGEALSKFPTENRQKAYNLAWETTGGEEGSWKELAETLSHYAKAEAFIQSLPYYSSLKSDSNTLNQLLDHALFVTSDPAEAKSERLIKLSEFLEQQGNVLPQQICLQLIDIAALNLPVGSRALLGQVEDRPLWGLIDKLASLVVNSENLASRINKYNEFHDFVSRVGHTLQPQKLAPIKAKILVGELDPAATCLDLAKKAHLVEDLEPETLQKLEKGFGQQAENAKKWQFLKNLLYLIQNDKVDVVRNGMEADQGKFIQGLFTLNLAAGKSRSPAPFASTEEPLASSVVGVSQNTLRQLGITTPKEGEVHPPATYSPNKPPSGRNL